MTTARSSLSQPQVEALLEGVHHKLVRAAADWVYLEVVYAPATTGWISSEEVKASAAGWIYSEEASEPVGILVMKRFRLSTVRSLHKRGLLSANFDDPRLHHCYCEESSTWLLDKCPLGSPLVWTSSLGRELLREKGLLPNNYVDNVIAFPAHRTKRKSYPALLRPEAEIVDFASYRESRFAQSLMSGIGSSTG